MPSQRPSNNGCGNLLGGGAVVLPPPPPPHPSRLSRAMETRSATRERGYLSARAPRRVVIAPDVSTTGAACVPRHTGAGNSGQGALNWGTEGIDADPGPGQAQREAPDSAAPAGP